MLKTIASSALVFIALGLPVLSGCSKTTKTRFIEVAAPPVLGPDDPLPGLTVAITAIRGATGPGGSFRSGDFITAVFTVHTDAGDPLELSMLARGAIMVSGPTFNYQRVIASQSDLIDRATSLGGGKYQYVFAVPIPSAYLAPYNDTDDLTIGELTGESLLAGTYTVGIELRKDYPIGDETFRDPGNATMDFRFGGAAVLEPREVVTLANCKQCHGDGFAVHGTNRLDVKNCVLCHTSGSEDRNTLSAADGTPGVTIDFKVMIHKIHAGSNLPSVNGVTTKSDGTRDYSATPRPYKLVGFRDSVHDFSHVQLPIWPSLSSPMPRDDGYSKLTSAQQGAENAIRSAPVDCAKCHGDPDGPGPLLAPKQGGLAYSQPARMACGSCHDDWVFTHPYKSNQQIMPAQQNDAACTLCHKAAGTALDVMDAHVHPLLNPTLTKGTNFDLISVTEAGASNGNGSIDVGEKVALTFTIRDNAGNNVDPSDLGGFSAVMTGPTSNQNLVHMIDIPVAALGAGPTYAMNLPERVYYQRTNVPSTTTGLETFSTARKPHWNVSGAMTEVFVRTATGAGSSLNAAAPARQNFIDLPQGNGKSFARNDYIVIDDGVSGKEEYMRVQFVDGDRLWFSSQYTRSYKSGLMLEHGLGAIVKQVTLTPKTADTDYTLDATKGEITEKIEFGAGQVIVSYTVDFEMPAVYRGTVNESPDLGEAYGDWVGKTIAGGTYTVGMYARQTVNVTVGSDTTTYRDTSPPATKLVLVGNAVNIEPNTRISSASNCYSCHNDIAFHGGGRRGYETCMLCHGNAGAEDRTRYVAGNAPPTTGVSVDFREMLHKIHRGKNLAKAKDYTVVGFGRTYPNNFSTHTYEHVGFPVMPSGTKQCSTCHGKDNDAWQQPTPRLHPMGQQVPTAGWRVACGSCHDSDEAAAHINANTSPSGAESCKICHERSETVNVLRAHRVR